MKKKIIDKLAYIDVRNNRVLVTLSKGKDLWYIPGGKREKGESDQHALTREVKEELSVDLIPATIKKYGSFTAQAHDKPEGTLVQMSCYQADFTGELQAAAEIAEFDYFAYGQKSQTAKVDQLIFDDLKKRKLIK